jgi:DNA-directed RNA polymerase specialized sigma24 family protein
MALTGSVTRWLRELKAGNDRAAQKLWERYFQRLVGLARTKLRNRPLGLADEEDVALGAFDSFCRGAQQGRFPQLLDRDDLWQLLVMMVARKAADAVQQEQRQKRGGKLKDKITQGSGQGPTLGDVDLEQIIGSEPSPEFAAQVADECRRLLELLGTPELRSIAIWKMEGYTNAEIAKKLGCVGVTIERRLRLIRGIWHKRGTG